MNSKFKDEIEKNVIIVKKIIKDALYKKKKSGIGDTLLTEMIIMSGYLSHFLEDGRKISKSEHNHIMKMMSRLEEIKKETDRV
ncbi:MAG: hypothetical protein KDC73_03710 [Ignavibacteriae bacterium]|nr:hypothetical protein [Ignavibacteriota bacterium]MCB9244173.1 hypothetical protein [Ignavibacteriales bacterium]